MKNYDSLLYAVGFYPWKKNLLRVFRPDAQIKFLRSPKQLPQQRGENLQIALWGLDFANDCFPESACLTRYEDGFIRSVGLGATFSPAYSWVADDRGIYFDARQPSGLEMILQNAVFPDALVERAGLLRNKILEAGITKYNLSAEVWKRPPGCKRVILVPGQVETDASILYGSPQIRSNLALLKTVRDLNPDACLIYKPHPDIVSKRRSPGAGEEQAAKWCNEIVTSASMDQLLVTVDEVHVMTSQAGFEALLRGKLVVTYGHPFYAGWGLTTDFSPPPRRTRKLQLDELVAGSLIKYPLYLNPLTNCRCEPEDLIEVLRAGVRVEKLSLMEKFLRRLSESPLWLKFVAK